MGDSRSLTDTSACPLTCAGTSPSPAAYVLLSRRSRGAQDDHRRPEHPYSCAPELILPDVTYCSHQLHGDFTVQLTGAKVSVSPPAGESMALAHTDFNEHDRATSEDHFAHAPGKACQACERTIEPGQAARRVGEADWVHDVCPLSTDRE
jgi:hypothetical protein